jgi:hypothetical protein
MCYDIHEGLTEAKHLGISPDAAHERSRFPQGGYLTVALEDCPEARCAAVHLRLVIFVQYFALNGIVDALLFVWGQ